MEQFQELSEEGLRDFVLEILTNPKFSATEDFHDIVDPISKREKQRKGDRVFVLRGPTGRKAEEFFEACHKSDQCPHPGILRDTREMGCGYDFLITGESCEYYVEVKGLDKETGGIALTSKEWDVASKMGKNFYLAIVRNLSANPQISSFATLRRTLRPAREFSQPFRYAGT